METNPYAPPKAAVSDVDTPGSSALTFPIAGGLYTSRQHFVAAFLGSPVAAALIAATNYRKLNREREARTVVVWGIVATAALIGLAYVLPDKFPNSLLPILYCTGVSLLAENRFGAALKAHFAADGKAASWWRLIGISLLSLLVLLGVLFAGVLALSYFGVIA